MKEASFQPILVFAAGDRRGGAGRFGHDSGWGIFGRKAFVWSLAALLLHWADVVSSLPCPMKLSAHEGRFRLVSRLCWEDQKAQNLSVYSATCWPPCDNQPNLRTENSDSKTTVLRKPAIAPANWRGAISRPPPNFSAASIRRSIRRRSRTEGQQRRNFLQALDTSARRQKVREIFGWCMMVHSPWFTFALAPMKGG